ncbi:hypothetical protein E3P92_01174 [Wallemia ichthyophaga]|nr:hypothetical protein E3P92_01174 [Wallemia ichthyophaga]TIB34858.1 hypothetical protein E3P84_01606 [Wallemia ichthyophaga]TIB41913.1 hypothetical protein E3P83_01555 [Wallemia ichthyophaga]
MALEPQVWVLVDPAVLLADYSIAFFSQSMGSFRWLGQSQGQEQSQTEAQPQTQPPQSLYATLSSSISDYIPLNSQHNSNEQEAYFALNRWERFLGFVICLIGSAACFLLSFFLFLPILPIRPHKFALAFSMGSVLVMAAFALLVGPLNHLKHLLSRERIVFSVSYLSSLSLTIYFALIAKSYIGVLVAGLIQLAALLTYIFQYFPGGLTTLKFGGRMAFRGASNILPI